jgi:hypothetical protein
VTRANRSRAYAWAWRLMSVVAPLLWWWVDRYIALGVFALSCVMAKLYDIEAFHEENKS